MSFRSNILLPGMDGFEATRQIMRRRPTPIVVVSASGDAQDERSLSMKALAAGALVAMEKPRGNSRGSWGPAAIGLCTQLAIMSRVKVVRQRPHAAVRAGETSILQGLRFCVA